MYVRRFRLLAPLLDIVAVVGALARASVAAPAAQPTALVASASGSKCCASPPPDAR